MNNFENRKKLALANQSRMFLYYGNFITEAQNRDIHDKLNRFKSKNKIEISREQLNSVECIYNDNPKDDFDCKIIEHEANYEWGNDYTFLEIHGYASGRIYTLKDEEGVAYIEGLHVSEKERLKLLGTDMLNRLIDKCKEIGAKECFLWCDKHKWMYQWYQSIGFKYYEDKADQEGFVWMVKELSN